MHYKSFDNFRIYVDTNVLRNYFTKQSADRACLDYVFSKRRKEILFTSTFAVGQIISGLQKGTKERKAFSREKAIESLDNILLKFSIVDFTKKDLDKVYLYFNNDIEDNIHYVLSQKAKCNIIITNNISDYSYFKNIIAVSPKNYSFLRKSIK
ncbi:MAG: type II toxin-antitoxin system VapC family toxin [Bacteroidales bacterium]|jgi:predicted nucleic acid-binding protein|nr:type II toxin-antitoxin system VapC family toxin [Bacteroidales bacterium]